MNECIVDKNNEVQVVRTWNVDSQLSICTNCKKLEKKTINIQFESEWEAKVATCPNCGNVDIHHLSKIDLQTAGRLIMRLGCVDPFEFYYVSDLRRQAEVRGILDVEDFVQKGVNWWNKPREIIQSDFRKSGKSSLYSSSR